MRFNLIMTLVHDGKLWHASNDIISISASELNELDEALLDHLRLNKLYPEGTTLKVNMNFDQRVIPEWIRQYANHYFNRSITLKI